MRGSQPKDLARQPESVLQDFVECLVAAGPSRIPPQLVGLLRRGAKTANSKGAA